MARPRDLCTLDRARNRIGLKDAQVGDDPFLEDLIAEVSDELYRLTGREFISAGATFTDPANPAAGITVPLETRTFYATGAARYAIGDLTDLTAATADGSDILATVRALPTSRPAGWPYTALVTLDGVYLAGATIAVTGHWGWPAVPEDVRGAVAAEVKLRYQRSKGKRTESAQLEALDSPEARAGRLSSEFVSAWYGYRPIGPVLT